MFERLFGKLKDPEPEEGERLVQEVVEKELSNGINGTALYLAFKAAKEKNQGNSLGLTNNHLLNIVKDEAKALSTVMDDELLGGPEQTASLINAEIDKLRNELTDEKKRS